MLPINIPFENVSSFQISDLIVDLLVKNASWLSVKEITCEIRKIPSAPRTTRYVRMVLMSLEEKDIVVSYKEIGENCIKYSISTVALQEVAKRVNRALEKKSVVELLGSNIVMDEFTQTITFKCIRELDFFLENFERFWIENIRSENDNMIVYEQQFNRQCLYNTWQNIQMTGDSRITYFVLCKHDILSTRKYDGKWKSKNVFFRFKADIAHSCDLILMGQFLITIHHSPEIQKHMEKVFKGAMPSTILHELLLLEGEIIVTVKKNRAQANKMGGSLDDKFLTPEFKELNARLEDQRRRNVPLYIDDMFKYLLDEQVNLLEQREGDATDRDLPWFVNKDRLDFLQSHFKDLLQFFDTNKPLTVIDLGIGPFIKPVMLLNQLNDTFPALQYIGVDYSQELINRAKKTSRKFLSTLANPIFLKEDFCKFKDDPNLLLDHVLHEQKLILLLGGEYAVFDADETRDFLGPILAKSTYFIIDSETLQSSEEYERLRSRYENPGHLDFRLKPFAGLGIHRDHFANEHYKFDEQKWEVVGIADLVKDPVLPTINLQKGDKVQYFRARKPRLGDFEQEMKQLGGQVGKKVEVSIHRGEKNLQQYCLALGRVL